MIWFIFVLMAAIAVAILVLPLLRAQAKTAPRVDFDLAVYKDQLTEIERDLERGVLTADQAEAARVEVQRRLLAAADRGGVAKATSPRRSAAVAAAIAVLVPAVGFGFYAVLGSPSLPDMPHSARAPEAADMEQQAQVFHDMVAKLAARLEENPDDGKGWAMMGRSLRVLGQPEQAHEAYGKALKLLPTDAQVRLEYGALLLDGVPQGESLPAEFVALMRDVLRLQPDQADALYFLGIAEAQAGRAAKAREMWTRLLEQLEPGSEDRAQVIRMIEGL